MELQPSSWRPHGWHFNFKWKGLHYRLSLDRECRQRITSKTDAESEADRIRHAIRQGSFTSGPTSASGDELTFRQFAAIWKERKGVELVNARDNAYRLERFYAFVLPGVQPALSLGEKRLEAITTDDVEALRDARKAAGLSPVTVNQDLRLLRKMFNWGVRKGYLQRTPFKVGTETVITLEREIPRSKRFENAEDETRLLNAANPHLRGVIIAMLDTACRPGEILSLQWKDVNLERKELTIQAAKSKTRTARVIPISTRLSAVLEMRRLDPAGRSYPREAYVFGDSIGRRIKFVRAAWNNACAEAGLEDFQLRDLRHEAGSRFEEAGVPINYVSNLLGHSNLTTTSRYLNINRRGLHLAMQRYEESRKKTSQFAQKLHKPTPPPQAVVQQPDSPTPRKSQSLRN